MVDSVLTHDVLDLVLSVMEGLNCPRSLGVAILLRYGEVDQLVALAADPLHYSGPQTYFEAASATDMLRKFVSFRESEDSRRERDANRLASTIEKWYWAERECYAANERLSKYIYGTGSLSESMPEYTMTRFITELRKNVVRLIGHSPPKDVSGRFGPGATVSDPSRAATALDKMSSVPTLTPSCIPFLVPWIGTSWGTASAELGKFPRIVKGDIFFTVPKDAKIYRGCAKVPSINGFYQLGFGRVLKARLLDSGLDLKNGQSIHRRVACAASKSGDFATIDLTSASDCLCYNLVKVATPPRWFSDLNALRSPYCEIEGKRVRLEKFSAMGNGYTFELETTIFAAIIMTLLGSRCALGINVFVYGDDLIVPKDDAPSVIAALKWFGFSPNLKKTFIEGSFRESCGGDFYDGMSVRAHFLEEDPNEPQKLISLANGLNRLLDQRTVLGMQNKTLRRAWFKCLDLIPTMARACRGPVDLGDIVIHDVEAKWVVRWRSGIRYIRVYRPLVRAHVRFEGFAYSVQWAAALYGIALKNTRRPKSFAGNELDFRCLADRYSEVSYKVGWTSFS